MFFVIVSLNPESATENKQKTTVKNYLFFPLEKKLYTCVSCQSFSCMKYQVLLPALALGNMRIYMVSAAVDVLI